MQLRDETNRDLGPRPGAASARARLARAGVLAISAALAATGATATLASASSTHAPKSSNPYASVESQLTALENAAPSGVKLLETGSTLLYPVISTWASMYNTVHVTTAGTGSGTGISDATNGTVQIGASDAYLSPTQLAAGALENIPVAISAQQIDYNLPGVAKGTHLKLNATVINDIYDGKITKWNDSAITSLNPGVKLPSIKIVPFHRSDGSGDTFLFSSYLAFQDHSSWVPKAGGPNTTISWPSNPNALAENGNGGMAAGCEATPGCIAYIGVSWLRTVVAHGIGYAQIENGKGNYVLPTPGNIAAEVASYKSVPANAALSLINSSVPKYGYPIVNFEYAIVNKTQSSTSTAKAIQAFLSWGMDPRKGSASSVLSKFFFQPLSPTAMQISVNLLKQVK
ncbi:MAG: phosphate ABC transporter substrate-binding protein PstS [Actinomycetota bacterium]|nr:phosphate ABC transporter substrate-binding protein PstS [Actinomycetota bacterium]